MTTPPTSGIIAAHPSQRAALLRLAVDTGLFSEDEAEALLGGVLDAQADGQLADGHVVLVLPGETPEEIVGWLYAAPDAYADRVWNLWWIGVAPGRHGSGAGTTLLRAFEAVARAADARVLVIETSASPPLARARRFYEREGYSRCGVIPDFYAPGDDKVIFARSF